MVSRRYHPHQCEIQPHNRAEQLTWMPARSLGRFGSFFRISGFSRRTFRASQRSSLYPSTFRFPDFTRCLTRRDFELAGSGPAKASKQMVLCPKCGRYGTPNICHKTKDGKRYAYLYINHGDCRCYVGPVHQFDELLMNFDEQERPKEKASFQASFAERVVRPPGFEPGLQAREA